MVVLGTVIPGLRYDVSSPAPTHVSSREPLRLPRCSLDANSLFSLRSLVTSMPTTSQLAKPEGNRSLYLVGGGACVDGIIRRSGPQTKSPDGVSVLWLLPNAGHLLLSGSMDSKIKVS